MMQPFSSRRRTAVHHAFTWTVAALALSCSDPNGPGVDAAAPSVTTIPASELSATTATLNGSVNPNGETTTYWFEWSTSSMLATATSTVETTAGSGIAESSVNVTVTGLAANTTYYFRIVARSSVGMRNGSILSFTTGSTPAVSPAVTTEDASNVTTSSAVLNGTVTPGSVTTSVWFEHSTSATLATFVTTPVQTITAGAPSTPISYAINLASGTTYYYRVAASAGGATVQGAIKSFHLFNPGENVPTVSTGGATAVTSTGATLNGTINPQALATTWWFEWQSQPAPFTSPTRTPTRTLSAGASAVDVASTISGLQPGVTYYFRLVAENAKGTTAGNSQQFTSTATGQVPTISPSLVTVSPSSTSIMVTAETDVYATRVEFEYHDWNTSTFSPLAQVTPTTSTATYTHSPVERLIPYTYRARACNAYGCSAYTQERTTSGAADNGPPAARTDPAQIIGKYIEMKGTVIAGGSSTTMSFEVSASPAMSNLRVFPASTTPAGLSPVVASATLVPAREGSVSYYRVVATNAGGTVRGAVVQTPPAPLQPPYSTVSAPTNVSPGTVTLNGTVDPLGGETTYWFEWGQNPTPTGITPYTRLPSATIPGTNSATPVSASLSGLVSGRTYYFRISAVNPAGTGTSTILGFVAP